MPLVRLNRSLGIMVSVLALRFRVRFLIKIALGFLIDDEFRLFFIFRLGNRFRFLMEYEFCFSNFSIKQPTSNKTLLIIGRVMITSGNNFGQP